MKKANIKVSNGKINLNETAKNVVAGSGNATKATSRKMPHIALIAL
jgi:hypothetical protein